MSRKTFETILNGKKIVMWADGRIFVDDQEYICRDKRTPRVSSSALGQKMFNDGPKEMTWIDIDGATRKASRKMLRIIEWKAWREVGNTNHARILLGDQQYKLLSILDRCIRFVVRYGIRSKREDITSEISDGGCFVIEATIQGLEEGRRKCEPITPFRVWALDGKLILQTTDWNEVCDWLNGGKDWTPRRGAYRKEWREPNDYDDPDELLF